MRLKADGDELLSMNGDEPTLVARIEVRAAGGKICPSIVLAARLSAGDLQRVLGMIGPTRIVPLSARPFVLEPKLAPGASRLRTLQTLRRLEAVGEVR